MAVVLEDDDFRVIQARTPAEAIDFCQCHRIHLLVADVSSLGPQPVETRRLIQQVQPHVKVVLVSGFDEITVEASHPGLLIGAQFFQKPFHVRLLAPVLHLMARAPAGWQQLEITVEEGESSA
jgi:DNA-binding NtrC family response regulator